MTTSCYLPDPELFQIINCFNQLGDLNVREAGIYAEDNGFQVRYIKYSTTSKLCLEYILMSDAATVYNYSHLVYHRLSGPARIFRDGKSQYWLFGKRYTKDEWERRVKLMVFL